MYVKCIAAPYQEPSGYFILPGLLPDGSYATIQDANVDTYAQADAWRRAHEQYPFLVLEGIFQTIPDQRMETEDLYFRNTAPVE